MSSKSQIFKELDAIKEGASEIIFRMAIAHLFDVGYRNLTQDNVKSAIEEIMKDEKESKKNGTILAITPECLILIVETAYKLRDYSVWDLLKYIKRNIYIA